MMAMSILKCVCMCVVLSNAARVEDEDIGDMTGLATGRNNEGAVVIDVGTYQIKASVLGEEFVSGNTQPSELLRSTHQVSKQKNAVREYEKRDGEDEHSRWTTTYPIKEGHPEDWGSFENLLRAVFKSLGVDPEGSSVILVYSASGVSKLTSEKMVTVLFETFGVDKLAIYDQAVMAMLSSGVYASALVVNIGEDVTYALGVYEMFTIPHTKEVSKFGSKSITDCINKKLWNGDPAMVTSARAIKEAKAKVLIDYDDELVNFKGDSAQLVDGTQQTVGDEIFSCPERLLNPEKFVNEIGNTGPGIIDIAVKAISKIDSDVREDAVNNIVITGGGAKIPGLVDRLLKGIEQKLPAKYAPIKDKGSQSKAAKQNMAWDGAVFFASLDEAQLEWMTKEDYGDNGAQIVHQHVF